MKNSLKLLLAGASFALFSCSAPGPSQTDVPQVTITNPSKKAQEDAIVVIQRSELSNLALGQFPLLTIGNDTVPSQFDDLDQDGEWDEWVLLVNIPGDSTLGFNYTAVSKSQLPVFVKRTAARLAMAPNRDGKFEELTSHIRPKDHEAGSRPMLYQYEGVGWENDKVAFRSYFDSRNGKDIFGKRIPDMMLSEIGAPGTQYHDLEDWGMDVLKVGSSLGAGAWAISIEDSIFRLGETEEAKYTLVSTGPIRTIVDLDYQGWKVKENIFNAKERITMTPGNYCYQSKLQVTSGAKTPPFDLVVGLVHMKDSLGLKSQQHGGDFESHFTLSEQSENHDKLGMGVLLQSSKAQQVLNSDTTATDGITDTYLFPIKPDENGSATIHFFAGWELSHTKFQSPAGFRSEIDKVAQQNRSPLQVSF